MITANMNENPAKENSDSAAQPFVMVNGNSLGSLTFGQLPQVQGEVMKLHINIQPQEVEDPSERPAAPQLLGTHIREAVAIVKDWKKRP
jgi:hypothetical protein